MGMSLAVLIVCLVYNVKIKGFGGWVHELFAAPFGDHWALYPFNFLMQVIEFGPRPFRTACGCSAICMPAN
jgi:F-type H+-transporting ATPase subunit a